MACEETSLPHPETCPGARAPGRAGSALSALPFWITAFLVFVLPFLRSPDDDRTPGEDPRAETDVPFAEDLALVEEELELELAAPLAEASERWFSPTGDVLRTLGVVEVARLESGEELYGLHCLGCHGALGDGAGPAARYLNPRPRNFRRGIFKFTSTGTGQKPRRSDLMLTIGRGLAGSAMPAFHLLTEEKRKDIVEYVRWLSVRGEFEQLYLDDAYDQEEVPDADELAQIVVDRWQPENARAVYPASEETSYDPGSIERGRELFISNEKGNCAACHGETGRGDGPSANEFLDDWGYPIRPRDFTRGVFRVGEESEDLWRSIATGINGTPMGSFRETLTQEELWDLVHYVQYSAKPEAQNAQGNGGNDDE